MSFDYIEQLYTMDCGTACLRMIALHYGKEYSAQTVQQLCPVTHDGVSLLGISDAAAQLGFRTVCGRLSLDKLVSQRPFPCILHWNQEHFVVLYDVKTRRKGKRTFRIADPAKGLLLQVILGLLLGSLLQFVFPFLTQAIVDKGIAHKNLPIIYLIRWGNTILCVLFLVLLVLYLLFGEKISPF